MIKIIGQAETKKQIAALVMSGFPRCTLLIGIRGSGKRLMSEYIADRLEAEWVMIGSKVAEVRDAIELMQKRSDPTVYVFPDLQDMSSAAKNSLLKITEEPPKNAYIVLTAINRDEVLPTIVSRSYLLQMADYWDDELIQYAKHRGYPLETMSTELQEFAVDVARVPAEMDRLFTYDVEEFMLFMRKVINNIASVSGTNALKIQKYLSLKENEPGYDLTLFLRAFIELCSDVILSRPVWVNDAIYRMGGFVLKYNRVIAKSSMYLQELTSISGLNAPATFDMWVLDVRKVLIDQ